MSEKKIKHRKTIKIPPFKRFYMAQRKTVVEGGKKSTEKVEKLIKIAI